ncbi:hypothetical protein RF55_11264 [Lasius niger]|uniref:GIY-YIG domain-containing protein n=1 Tax=Lasius niger TaxID=67767 RepID=A0A0J7KFF0_LASNI|nr:hypothetical protein RF55_11264 [Lasius niger]
MLFFNVPYVPMVSERFNHIIGNLDMKISYTGTNKLNKFIKVHKDSLPKNAHNNVVYKISCGDCDASYVGQTKRSLKTRIGEHRNHITRNTIQRSVITDHRLLDHEFLWDDVEILDEEPFLSKRLVSEMIFIKRQVNSLNLQSGTENLDHVYTPTIEKMIKL